MCSCAYHDGDCYCCADKIQVGPASACTCGETVCATFRERTGKAVRSSGARFKPFLRGDGSARTGRASAPGTLEAILPREKRSILCAGRRFGLWAEPPSF